ncbi:hypothetical protein G3485_22525 [Shewanella baltica]|uniref:hypothetical protein n=1 Tax=Shewanella baltica TaxID=62322 RepID=UPI002168D392|nr:hypothetical protein [Shewanella baltica]MCS6116976.1 hypothetical protein [Shewanella baltica]MCS6129887.1 hypothetical protein [Shewanella baltica]MCS6141784.1 hypothetical protein [Shewanella baltica]MCS6148118.1 hypothetical protein [Shewanella baltica]MCS6172672.1 hypothetical protein [Shewanella baltica]
MNLVNLVIVGLIAVSSVVYATTSQDITPINTQDLIKKIASSNLSEQEKNTLIEQYLLRKSIDSQPQDNYKKDSYYERGGCGCWHGHNKHNH